MSQEQRRLAAIMFTDMVGYTALGQRNEDLSLALVDEQRKLFRPIFTRHNGREIKAIGDGFLVEFPNALDAVRCAYDIQRATREFNFSLPETRRIHLRVGVHVGDIVESYGDISGDAVNVASRVEPLARDGEVALTRQVRDHVQSKFELPLVSIGMRSLKNVETPIEIFRIIMPWENEPSSQPSQLDPHRIAVMPFRNLSPDSADDYFADGVTEEIITALSGIRRLTVIARTSVMQYKGVPKRVLEIGRDLNCGTLVEGSVRKSGNKVRVTVQAVRALDEGHIWAKNYEKELKDVFAIQSDIASQVSKSLRVRMLADERQRIEKPATSNPHVHTLYLKGRYWWNERNEEDLRKAIDYFRKATEIDDRYALGYAGLADSYYILSDYSAQDFEENLALAEKFALKAIELDPRLAEPHATLGGIQQIQYRWKQSESEFKLAIDLNPSYATAHQWYAITLMVQERWDETWREIRRALELDPMSLIIRTNIGIYHLLRNEYAKAIAELESVLELNPNFLPAHESMFDAHYFNRRPEECKRQVDAMERVSKDNPSLTFYRGLASIASGDLDQARRYLTIAEGEANEKTIQPSLIGYLHLGLGDIDEAFDWFEKAYELHDSGLRRLRASPEFDSVRDNPRYRSLLKKVGLESNNYE